MEEPATPQAERILQAALHALRQWENGISLDDILDSHCAAPALRRTLGSVLYSHFRHLHRHRLLLQGLLRHAPPQEVEWLLLLTCVQVFQLDGLAPESAVNIAVDYAKKHYSRSCAALVNAVMRRAREQGVPLPTARNVLPPPVYKLWQRRYAPGQLETLAQLQLQRPPFTFRACGDFQPPAEPGLQALALPWLNHYRFFSHLSGQTVLERPWLAEGRVYIQDPAAALAVEMLDWQLLPSAPRLLDLCAAPGGKSFALAIDMGDKGDILSCDVHPHKLKLIENGAARLGLRSIRTALADGRERHEAWIEQADVVVADVPCSGLGIIRKKPDIRYKDPKELAKLPREQRAILENAASYVRPGGTLIYSTCTVLPEENQEVITWFLKGHPEFRLSPFVLPAPIGGCDGHLTLWPQRWGTDGFYICRLEKQK